MTNDNNFESIEKEIEPLIKRVMVGLRTTKKVDVATLEKIHEKLESYTINSRSSILIEKSFVSKIFYLFSTMVLEAHYIGYDKDIMNEVFKLRVSLLNLFDGIDK